MAGASAKQTTGSHRSAATNNRAMEDSLARWRRHRTRVRQGLAVAGAGALALAGAVQVTTGGIAAAAPAPAVAVPAGSGWPTACSEDSFLSLTSASGQPGQTVTVGTFTDETVLNTNPFDPAHPPKNGITPPNNTFAPQWGISDTSGNNFVPEDPKALGFTVAKTTPITVTIPSGLAPGTHKGWVLAWDSDQNKSGGDCGVAPFNITVNAPPAQSLAGHFFQCTNGAATATEISGGTLTGSQAGQSNVTVTPSGVSVPTANTWRVDATPPSGFQLASCTGETAASGGAFPTVVSPSSANENVVVPVGGTGTANFYVTPITQSITGQIINCATNQEAGTGTLRAAGPSNEQVPAGGATQADPMNAAAVQNAGDWTMFATAPAGTQFVSACGQTGNGTTSSQTKTVPSGGSQTFTFFVTPNPNSPSLTLSKTASVSTVTAPGSFNYTLVARNGGPGDATHAVVSDPVPSGLTINGTPTTTQGGCTVSGQTVSCALGTLTANSSATIVINVTATGTVCGPVDNTGTLTADNGTAPPATARVTIVCPNFNISLQKSASASQVTAGQGFTYTLVATNTGGAAANNVVVTDAIPSKLGISGTPTSTLGTCSTSGNNVTCNLGTLAAANSGGTNSATITIQVTTTTSSCGTVTNTGQVSASGGTTGNSNTVTTTIVCPNPSISVGVVKTNNAQDPSGTDFGKTETAANPGETFTYQAVITNNSSADEVIGTVTDLIAGQPVEDVCSSLVGTTLAAGASVTCTFPGVAPTASGSSVTDTVTVPVTQVGNPSNTGTGTDTSTVQTAPGVIITKANNASGNGFGTNETVAAGATSVPYRVTVTNPNSSPATITVLTDSINGTVSNICPDLIGTVLAPKGQAADSAVCDFTTSVPTTITTDTAGVTLSVNGVTVSGTAQSTVLPPVLGTVITPPATPAPAALAFTGAPIGKMVTLALGLLGLGLLALLALEIVDGPRKLQMRYALTEDRRTAGAPSDRPARSWDESRSYQTTAVATVLSRVFTHRKRRT